jgi:hypothetical protein
MAVGVVFRTIPFSLTGSLGRRVRTHRPGLLYWLWNSNSGQLFAAWLVVSSASQKRLAKARHGRSDTDRAEPLSSVLRFGI